MPSPVSSALKKAKNPRPRPHLNHPSRPPLLQRTPTSANPTPRSKPSANTTATPPTSTSKTARNYPTPSTSAGGATCCTSSAKPLYTGFCQSVTRPATGGCGKSHPNGRTPGLKSRISVCSGNHSNNSNGKIFSNRFSERLVLSRPRLGIGAGRRVGLWIGRSLRRLESVGIIPRERKCSLSAGGKRVEM
jgi:hypothetical protein